MAVSQEKVQETVQMNVVIDRELHGRLGVYVAQRKLGGDREASISSVVRDLIDGLLRREGEK